MAGEATTGSGPGISAPRSAPRLDSDEESIKKIGGVTAGNLAPASDAHGTPEGYMHRPRPPLHVVGEGFETFELDLNTLSPQKVTQAYEQSGGDPEKALRSLVRSKTDNGHAQTSEEGRPPVKEAAETRTATPVSGPELAADPPPTLSSPAPTPDPGPSSGAGVDLADQIRQGIMAAFQAQAGAQSEPQVQSPAEDDSDHKDAPAPALPGFSGAPEQPRVHVAADLGSNMGRIGAYYHQVIESRGCVALIYDTRYAGGFQWVPPAQGVEAGGTPLTLHLEKNGPGIPVIALEGLNFQLGELDVVVLLKAPEPQQAQPAQPSLGNLPPGPPPDVDQMAGPPQPSDFGAQYGIDPNHPQQQMQMRQPPQPPDPRLM